MNVLDWCRNHGPTDKADHQTLRALAAKAVGEPPTLHPLMLAGTDPHSVGRLITAGFLGIDREDQGIGFPAYMASQEVTPMNVAHTPNTPPNPADDTCPCNTGTAQTEIPTLMGHTVHVDACTTWGVGLGIHPDAGGHGYSTQLSVGQARDLATALTAAANAIEQAVTAETPEMTKAAPATGPLPSVQIID